LKVWIIIVIQRLAEINGRIMLVLGFLHPLFWILGVLSLATAKILGATTVAEFISSKGIFDKTLELGIDQFQGYYIGKPDKELKKQLS